MSSTNEKLDLLFRHEYGRLVALFTNRYAAHMIDQIEDAVQEALYKAEKNWSYHQVPDNPQAWTYRVANNSLIDSLRKLKRETHMDEVPETEYHEESFSQDELVDEQLQMIFACCHPAMTTTEQLMLSLKLLCGLSVKEIARALLKQGEATKKAITRAKKKFKEQVGELKVPLGSELTQRMEAVLQVIYLLFNEGYKATTGGELMRNDLCEEAIRLAFLLTNVKDCNDADLNALISLMLFISARFPARQDADGNLVTLEHQDRSLYDQEYIDWAWKFLKESSTHQGESVYQLEAAISYYYTRAKNYEATNWKVILGLYDRLATLKPSPVVLISRLLVSSKVEGAAKALVEMDALEETIEVNQSFCSIES